MFRPPSPRSFYFGSRYESVFCVSYRDEHTGECFDFETWDPTLLAAAASMIGRLRGEREGPEVIEAVLEAFQKISDRGVRLYLAGASPATVNQIQRDMAQEFDAVFHLPVSLLSSVNYHRVHRPYFE